MLSGQKVEVRPCLLLAASFRSRIRRAGPQKTPAGSQADFHSGSTFNSVRIPVVLKAATCIIATHRHSSRHGSVIRAHLRRQTDGGM